MKKTLAAISFLSMLSVTPVFAADNMDMDHMKMMCAQNFKMMDTNGDGKVSKQEYMDAMDKKFMEMDVHHDGMLTEQEIMDGKMKEMKMMNDGMMNKQ